MHGHSADVEWEIAVMVSDPSPGNTHADWSAYCEGNLQGLFKQGKVRVHYKDILSLDGIVSRTGYDAVGFHSHASTSCMEAKNKGHDELRYHAASSLFSRYSSQAWSIIASFFAWAFCQQCFLAQPYYQEQGQASPDVSY
jgi:hypothetical protein